MEGLRQVSQPDLHKLFQKNALLDVLGNEGQQIVVVGDTSTGKSTVINFLLGFPINFEAQGIGTRRPCVLTQVQKPGQKKVQFEGRFCKAGETLEVPLTEDPSDVARLVANANDHHHMHFFECLPMNCSVDEAYQQAFDHEPVYVKMFHEDFKYGLRLVDLPGLTRRNPSPMHIAATYIQPGNIAILVVGRDNAANGGFPDLAECMTKCQQVLVVQNFAYRLLKDSTNVQDNFDCIKKAFTSKKSNHANDLQVYAVDFGKPKTKEFESLWKASTDQQVEDQESWQELAASGGLQVQVKMYKHASRWGQRLQKECQGAACKDGRDFDWGILPVLNKIVTFQLDGVDQQISELKEKVRNRIEQKEEELEELMEKIERLKDPAEWQDLLARLAKVVSEFLDTTIAIPDEKDEPEICKALMTTAEEVDETVKFMEAYEKDSDDKDAPDYSDKNLYYWFSEELDARIRRLVERPLEVNEKLANLRSWQRLLDELTAMLAFAPMPHILRQKKEQAYHRIGAGRAASMNKLDIMVELVSEAKLLGKQPIRSLLQTFKYRFLYLAHRDLKNCMRTFQQDLTHELRDFLLLLGEDTPERREKLCADLESGLLSNMREVISRTIDGAVVKDKRKRTPVHHSVTGRWVREERSGLCVRYHENHGLGQGPCHWLIPFKAHYVNGQIPWKDLRIDRSVYTRPPPPGGPEEAGEGGDEEEEEVDIDNPYQHEMDDELALEEVLPSTGSSMNAVNAVNMQIFNLATQPYDVVLRFDLQDSDGHDHRTDLEVMKMLKAMQAEIAAFWASAWKGMIQQIKEEAAQARELEQQLDQKLRGAGLLHNIESTKLKNDLKLAISAIHSIISGSDFPPELGKTTFSEIHDLGAEYNRTPWPGLAMAKYRQLLDVHMETDVEHESGGSFPKSRDIKCSGEMAWIRLCEEFIFVILQLAMRRATKAEISMAKASAGKSTIAGPFEIVTKLVLHRLRCIGQDSGRFFRTRMIALYDRDLKFAMQSTQSFSLSDIVPGVTGLQFVETFLRERAARVVDRTMASLQSKFNELLPFDFSILNGRLPLLKSRVRKVDFELAWDGRGMPEAISVPALQAEEALRECWHKSLIAQWPNNLIGQLKVVQETSGPRGSGSGLGLVLDSETNYAAFGCLNDEEAIAQVTHFGNLKDKDPPANNMAGGGFHSMLLRIHKAMHVNAIDHCRPKLKELMANIYQEEHVRSQLQRNRFLSKKAFEEAAAKRIQEAHEIKARVELMKKALELADSEPPRHVAAAEAPRPAQYHQPPAAGPTTPRKNKHWWGGW